MKISTLSPKGSICGNKSKIYALLLLFLFGLTLLPAAGVFRPARAAAQSVNRSTAVTNLAATSITLDSNECTTIGGQMVGTTLCQLSNSYTLGSGETLVIPTGLTLTVLASGTFTNDGAITVNSGGEIVVMGAIHNLGEISNSGDIYLYGTGSGGAPGVLTSSFSIENYGNIYTDAGTTLSNSGTINNYGTISNGGTVTNFGLINTSGTFNNYGTVNNDGIINGSIVNSGTINNNGTLNGSSTTVDSTWCTNLGGAWYAGNATQYATCDLNAPNGNSGVSYTIQSGDTLIIPQGTALTIWATEISVQGNLQNYGTITLSYGGGIIVNGSFYNGAVCGGLCGGYVELTWIDGSPLCSLSNLCNFIDSSGSIYNYGDIGSQYFGYSSPGYGAIYNRGFFDNYGNLSTPIDNANPGSTIDNFLSGSINAYIWNYGNVDNSGVMAGQAYVINEGGTFDNQNTLRGGFENDAGTVNDYGQIQLDMGAVWVYNQYTQQYEYDQFNTFNFATFNLYQNGLLIMKSGAFLVNNGTMNLYGYTNDSAAIYTFDPGYGGIDNQGGGVINIFNTVDIHGQFYNQGVVNNAGTIDTYCGSTYFQNLGTINNSATLNIMQGGSILNEANLLNSGTITNNGVFDSSGSISDTGTIYDYGTLNNTGTFFVMTSGRMDVYSSATLFNVGGNLNVMSSGEILNGGTINNLDAIYVFNSGSIVNTFFFGSGKIYNYGPYGYISIGTDGTLNNPSGAFIDNSALIDNGGAVTNTGTFINECGGQLTGAVNYPYTQLTCATVQVTLTTANSAPAPTIAVSGCDVSTSSLVANGNPVTLTADGSCSIKFTTPTDGTNTRYRFSDAGSPSATWTLTTCTSGTCSSETNIVYYQIQSTFSVTVNGGNPNTGDTIVISGSFLGASSNILALNVGGVSSASSSAWTDYGYSVTFPTTTSHSGIHERWATPSSIPTSIITSGGGTYSKAYAHQFLISFGYGDQDSSIIPSKTIVGSYEQFGHRLPVKAGSTYSIVSPAHDWVDAGTYVVYTSHSNGAERWALKTTTQKFDVITSTTISEHSYYHQFDELLLYQVNGGGNPGAPTFSADQFGSTSNQVLTTSSAGYWFDAGSIWTVSPNPLSGSTTTERWYSSQTLSGALSTTSSTTLTFSFYHQFAISFAVSPAGTGSTLPSGTNVWEDAGSISITATPSTGYSFNSWSASGLITFADASQSGTTATISGAGTITALFLQQSSSTATSSSTSTLQTKVPEFPLGGLGIALLIGFLIPSLLLLRRKTSSRLT